MPVRKKLQRGQQGPGPSEPPETQSAETAPSDGASSSRADTTICIFGRLPPGATGSTGSSAGQDSAVAKLRDAIHQASEPSEADEAMALRLLTLAHPSYQSDDPIRFDVSDMAGLCSALHAIPQDERQQLLSEYLTWQKQQAPASRAFSQLQAELSKAIDFSLDPEQGTTVDAETDPASGRGKQRHIFHFSSSPISPRLINDFSKTQASDARPSEKSKTIAPLGKYVSAWHHHLPPKSAAAHKNSEAFHIWKDVPGNTTHLSQRGHRSVQQAVDKFTDACDSRSSIAKLAPNIGFWAPVPTSIASNAASWLSSTAQSIFTRGGMSGTSSADAVPSVNWTKYRMDLTNSWRSDWSHSLQDPASWASLYDGIVGTVYGTLFGEDANDRRRESNVEQEVFDVNTGETRPRTKKDKDAGVPTSTLTVTFDPHKASIAHEVRDEVKAALVAAVRGGLNAEDARSARIKLGNEMAKQELAETESEDGAAASA
jgi:hypothetical protein